MARRVVISGLGPVCGLGLGMDEIWPKLLAGDSAIAPLEAFNASELTCQVASEIKTFKVRDYVPKTYRKATKVMARDIELAVAAADFAARDAGLVTPGTDPDGEPSYPAPRVGAHIGAGLIAADLDELTAALKESRSEAGDFDIHNWGSEGMQHLTPLWLLKYLPNMLACHVTIIHDTQGPSNTITCAEASSGLSIGESLRVIQRNGADLCFCGGAESKLNPMAFYRQILTGRLTSETSNPTAAVRPFDQAATGGALGEGGGIVTLESLDTFQQRGGKQAYAEVLGFGASQTVNRAAKNREPDPEGKGIQAAIRAALREAGVEANAIDLIVPFGCAAAGWDAAEAAALRGVFGDRLAEVPVLAPKASVGNCGAGSGGLDVAIAAKALGEQTIPAIINRDQPVDGIKAGGPQQAASLTHALVYSAGYGGQNTAMILKRFEG